MHDELRAELEAIWQRHRDAVFEQVDVIERAVMALMCGDADGAQREEATREAHKLTGSLGTFGFAAASAHARHFEELLGGDAVLTRAQLEELVERVTALRDALQQIPIAKEPTHAPAATTAESPLLVIVEDDVPLAERLAQEAAGRGLRVELAFAPGEVGAIVARGRPDAVLLDLTFPTGTAEAYELLSSFVAAVPPVPVLVSTVRDTLTDRVEVVRRGGSGFVTKSLRPEQVLDQVMRLIEREHAAETTLLSVDDDPVLLAAVRALIEPHEFRVVTLEDPSRFWHELDRIHPDVVLLDVDMPGVSGIELCRVLRNDARWATVPVLILTARRDRETIEEIFAAGADDYLSKPLLGSELLTRLRNRVERLQLHRALADTDSLTGVPNRHSSTQGIERLLRLATRYEQPLSLAAIDLDRFKAVNDEHGHAAGDAVLRRFGQLLLEAFRGEDVTGRWGGEEFVAGLYGMSGADALQRLTELLGAFEQETFTGTSGEFHVAFSAGISEYPSDGAHLGPLYRAADAALYRAKELGRGRVVLAQPPCG